MRFRNEALSYIMKETPSLSITHMPSDNHHDAIPDPREGTPYNPIEGFGERLAECRKQSGIEQQELAIVANVPAPSISHYERGHRKPSIENLVRLADALSVSIDFLLGRTDAKYAHVRAPLVVDAGSSQLSRREALGMAEMLMDYLSECPEPGPTEQP